MRTLLALCARVAGRGTNGAGGTTGIIPDGVLADAVAADGVIPDGVIPDGVITNSVVTDTVTTGIPVPPSSVPSNVGIHLVRPAGMVRNIGAERLCFPGCRVGFLLEPCGIYLRLLCVSTGTRSLGLALPGIKFHIFCLAADFGCLFPVGFIAFLLHCLPAPSGCQQQHNKDQHNNGHYHPNPWSCFQTTHHFPLRCPGRPAPFRLTFLEPL
jgi:hypothetical protein